MLKDSTASDEKANQMSANETNPLPRRLKCPSCGATRFHRADYVEVNDAGEDTIAITEFRCINCNRVFSRGELAIIG